MPEQLIKKNFTGGYSDVNPKSWIEAIRDKDTGKNLVEILQGFNMYFLSYTGNTASTRCKVPKILRKQGLWITYVKYDKKVYTEWYAAEEIDDTSWGNSSNWRIGNNMLVGDITISSEGNWIVDGKDTGVKALGKDGVDGITTKIKIENGYLYASYDNEVSWEEIGYIGESVEDDTIPNLIEELSTAVGELSRNFNAHQSDTSIHVNTGEKNRWNQGVVSNEERETWNNGIVTDEEREKWDNGIISEEERNKWNQGIGGESYTADEEDITLTQNADSTGKVYQFKNRDTSKGMGYIILRSNKTLAEQITEENTIYEIRYDFDLDGETLEIPANCVLDFKGGSLFNGEVEFNVTKLTGDVRVYSDIGGTIFGSTAILDWFIEDSTTDISDRFNQLVTIVKRIELSGKSYTCNGTINLASGTQIIGNGAALNSNGVNDMFNLPSNARGNIIENLTMYTEYNSSNRGCAIKVNSDNGGADQIYRDLFITGFYVGIYAGNIWWNNTIENVKCTTCGTSFYIYAPNGQSINNVFIKCYSNIAKTTGISLAGVKNCIFINCNNGLSSNDNSRFLQVSANSVGVKFLGCNFEDGSTKYSSDTLMRLSSASVISFEACTFAILKKADTSYTNTSIMQLSDTCQVTLIDCIGLENETDYDVFVQHNAKLFYRNLKSFSKIYTAYNSLTPEYKPGAKNLLLPVSGIATEVDNTVYIDTGLERVPTVTFSIKSEQAIGATIVEALSNGTFKLRFFNLSDGSTNTNLKIATVHWIAN